MARSFTILAQPRPSQSDLIQAAHVLTMQALSKPPCWQSYLLSAARLYTSAGDHDQAADVHQILRRMSGGMTGKKPGY